MKVLILGASLNPTRYSFLALNDLVDRGHEVLAVGNSEGDLRGISIQKNIPETQEIDTVTLYLSRKNQADYISYLLDLKPRRVIFNPGTEHPELEKSLLDTGVEVLRACTLVMLRTNQF